jgi:hypothetical protein
MIYIKTINITKIDNLLIEKAIRSFSLKRHGSLDLKQSSSYITEDNKFFLGSETDSYIKITRFRTPFENLLPKLILRFDKRDFNVYQIRFSFPSNLIYAILIIAIVLNLAKLIISGQFGSNIGSIIIISAIFTLLTLLEIKITTQKVKKAIDGTMNSMTIKKQ